MGKEKVVAIDVGYGYTKVVTQEQRIIFPSLVGPARELTFALGDKTEVPGETVTVSGETFFVGKKADLCDTTFTSKTRHWISSNIYAALIASSINRVMQSIDPSSEISVITGLPVDYLLDKPKAEAQVRLVASTLNLNLKSVKVIPQPFGTFFDYTLDMYGEPALSAKIGLLGVIDIGFHTTDYVLVRDLQNNLDRAAGSITTGVFTIIDGVRRDLMHGFGRNNITDAEAEDCVRRTKSIKIGRHNPDVSSVVDTHMRNTAQTIIGAVMSRWAQEGELDAVLLTGGGGALLKDFLINMSPNSQLVAGAQMANARGYFKHGLLLHKALVA